MTAEPREMHAEMSPPPDADGLAKEAKSDVVVSAKRLGKSPITRGEDRLCTQHIQMRTD